MLDRLYARFDDLSVLQGVFMVLLGSGGQRVDSADSLITHFILPTLPPGPDFA